MPLAPGTRLGPYEIAAAIGAGGMGEVYRARDPKLKRDVAIKVLPDAFARDPERMARFQREAEVLASLNHSNIAQIYGVEDRALVMELVDGESPKGPLRFEEAWKIAAQIADALEYAHERGIVHRDLKPANVKVTPEGVVKLLDFGLAKALSAPGTSAPGDQNNSPTLTMGSTQVGVILGTAAYMAPEQAKGKSVDKRADIWAFGVVLYELLTGERLFQGDDVSDILAQVLTKQPELDKVPSVARRLLAECLAKDPKSRLRDIGDAKRLLGEGAKDVSEPRPARRPWIPWAVTAVLFLGLAAALAWIFKPAATLPITRFPIALGAGQVLASASRQDLAVSPDGTQIAYVANRQLYVRSMSELEARPVTGDDLVNLNNPVFSPDGKSLAFFATSLRDQTIKRVPVTGGAPQTICASTAPGPNGMSWSEEGILFGDGPKGIQRVSPNGGQPETLIAAKENEWMTSPQMLPGGKEVLFTLASGQNANTEGGDRAQIVVQNVKSGERKIVLQNGADARYLPSGHIAYAVGGVLFAAAFDVGRLETRGSPIGVIEGIARSAIGVAYFAFSNTGTLVYRAGPVNGLGAGQAVLVLVDRKGDTQPLKVPAASYGIPRVSRDGKRVAYQIDDGKDSSIWIYELSGAAAPRRLTLPGTGANRYPVWSSDNLRVAFQSDREGDLGIWWQRADGSGVAERLTKPDKKTTHFPDSWSPDGQHFSFTEEKDNHSAVWTYSLQDKKATLFAEMAGASFTWSVFSPDGHWLAYQLSAQPNSRLYVKPFPPTAIAYLAPEDADAHHPVWSPDGKELFYVAGPSLFGSMSFNTQPSVSFGSPVRAPKSGFATNVPSGVRTYDILPDGKHFIGVVAAGLAQPGPGGPPPLQVVLNWFEDVKQRAPGK